MALLDNTDYRKPTDSRKTVRRMLAVLPALIVITVCYAVTVSAWFQASITSAEIPSKQRHMMCRPK